MLAIRLPPDLEKRLDALAKATGRTKTYYAREALVEHIERLEDLHLAEKRLASVHAGKSETFSLDEIERALGLAR